jgi:hypothetical protein
VQCSAVQAATQGINQAGRRSSFNLHMLTDDIWGISQSLWEDSCMYNVFCM